MLTGEAGTEYVVPNDLFRVPEVAGMVNLIEAARLRGSFRPVGLSAALAASGMTVPGRATGGYVGRDASMPATTGSASADGNTPAYDDSLLREVKEVVGKLSKQLKKPIPVAVSAYGRDGIFTIQKKIEQQQHCAGIGGRVK